MMVKLQFKIERTSACQWESCVPLQGEPSARNSLPSKQATHCHLQLFDMVFVDPDSPHPLLGSKEMHLRMETGPHEKR